MNTETKISSWIDRYMADIAKPARKFFSVLATAGEIQQQGNPLPVEVPKDFDGKVRLFGSFHLMSIYGIYQAGRLLCEMVSERPNTFEVLLKTYPHLNMRHLLYLQDIGEGRRDPRTMLLTDGFIRNRIESLPPAEQKRVFDAPIPVVTKIGNEIKTTLKPLNEATHKEKALAIGPGFIRTPEQQVAEIERKKQRKEHRYSADADGIEFLVPCRFTWGQVREIMEKHAPQELAKLQEHMQSNQIKKQ